MSEQNNHSKIILTEEQMRQLARCEITFGDLDPDFDFAEAEIICLDTYALTLDDLSAAIKNLRAADPTVEAFGTYWFHPIDSLDESFDRSSMDTVVPDAYKNYAFSLHLSDLSCFLDVWWTLDVAWVVNDGEKHLSEILNFDEILDTLNRHAENVGNPVEDWVFSDKEKEAFISCFETEELLKTATDRSVALARKIIDELCGQENLHALHIKGYACYGGNRLYPCDWTTSRDYMLRLFEKTDDPGYANTLGYICYYGRCNNGRPEYDKAFQYFSVAAAGGLHEGMYKLADLFRNGYGCCKSEKAARRLYDTVYTECYQSFVQEEPCSFADAALRMGSVYADGIGERVNPEEAYFYYMQADYAARLRAKESDFFGDTTVVDNIRRAINRVKPQLPRDYFSPYMEFEMPDYLEKLAENRFQCLLTAKPLDGGEWKLTGARISGRACRNPEMILITLPKISLCERTNEVSMFTTGFQDIWLGDDPESAEKSEEQIILYDWIGWNQVEGRCEFFFNESLTGWIRCRGFRIYREQRGPAHGPEYRLVSIRFRPNGRAYDYICDFEDVKIGDTVIVEGSDGETPVEVIGVQIRKESELPLPLDRYKKVKRKQ